MFSNALKWVLGVFRFLVVTALCLLVLEPLIRYFDIEIEPPIIVVATDNSSSITMGADSTESRAELQGIFNTLNTGLQEKFEIAEYSFGQSVRPGLDSNFTDAVTDISELFSSVSGRYANRNLGAVVLVSDGIYNRGKNPRYAVSEIQSPVYTIGVGDTTRRKDAFISEVAANRIAFLGNKFPIEAVVNANRFNGRALNYSIEKDGRTIESGTVDITSSQFETNVRFLLTAETVGLHRYTIRIGDLGDEVTLSNNRRSVFIDVIDSRQQVQILARAPHPDIAALRSAISTNENYEVEVVFEKDFKPNSNPADLIILHQIPSKNSSNELVEYLTSGSVPFLAIVGLDTDMGRLSKLGVGAKMGMARADWNDAGALLNTGFSLFKSSEELPNLLRDLPPLLTPFGKWNLSNSADVMLYQKIGQIPTTDPLLVFGNTPNRKNAVLLGEGIWRWRMYNYAKEENHEAFDQFVGSVVQYLSVKEDKRLFRVFGPTEVMENERVIFNAELYNAAFQPINEPEAVLTIADASGNEFPFTFSRSQTGYRLDAGALPIGNYRFVATINKDGESLIERGDFVVLPFALEGANLTANHQLLFNISNQSGGALYYPSNVNALVADLTQSSQVQPKSFSTEVLSSVLHFKWIFFVLMGLLSLEWVARKRAGHY